MAGLVVGLGGYLFQFLMARMLEVKSYGELQSLIALLTIFGIPSATLLTVIVRYVAIFKAKEEFPKIYTLFVIFTKKLLVIGFCLFVLFCLLSKSIGNFLQITSSLPIIILSTCFFVVFLESVNQGILQGLQKFKQLSIISITAVFFKIVLGALLVKLGFEINGAVGAIVLAFFIGYLISFFPLRFLFKNRKKGGRVDIKAIFKYSLPVFFSLFFLTLFYNLDMVLVKHFFPPDLAGQYGALAVIGHIIFFVGGPVGSVMFPMVASAHAKGDKHFSILKTSFLLVSLIGLCGLTFYFLIPSLVIKILVGSKFLSIVPYLGWFGLAMFLYSLIVLLSRYLLSIRLTKYIFILGLGIVLQVLLIFIWHSNLWQIVWIMNTVAAFVFILLIIFVLMGKRKNKEALRIY
jgi:O-antigen/teichoic acid export membrane protein